MSTFKPLKTLTSRRQVLKAGLAALTLSGMSQAIAKDEPLKTSNGHSKRKPKNLAANVSLFSIQATAGLIPERSDATVRKKNMWCWRLLKTSRSILRNHGIDARLTRSGDTFIPLYDRVEIAP
ncbi:N-acetylmuramoyl-L-alanine amidase [Escherichia coli]|uniref:N-acetylmuramoyl-L-alanine amidase n=1 Tax=Escherichia coli TaxID=562 RepID=A0A376L9K0_ECOLX|nr:N-acetylmuramoyl-L-alanine amidase [Escherichia coli]